MRETLADARGSRAAAERRALQALAAALILVYLAPPAVALLRGPLPLFEPSEARYAEISREMLESGDWLTPRLNGIKHLHKPPLTYWITALSMALLGENEWGARAPLHLASLGTVLCAFLLGRSLFGREAALLGALVLASAAGFQLLSRTLSTDPFLLFFCSAASLGAWKYLATRRPLWLILFSSCLGLGFLTKGPIGLLLPLLPAIAAGLVLRGSRPPAPVRLWPWRLAALALFLLLAVPWYFFICRANPGLFAFLLGKGVGPAVSAEGMHPGAVYYYLPVLLGGFFPWSLLLVPAFASLFRGLRRESGHEPSTERKEGGEPGRRPGPAPGAEPALRHRAAAVFLTCGSLGWILFFSLIPAKLPAYILPAYVPLALITGRWLAAVRRKLEEAGGGDSLCREEDSGRGVLGREEEGGRGFLGRGEESERGVLSLEEGGRRGALGLGGVRGRFQQWVRALGWPLLLVLALAGAIPLAGQVRQGSYIIALFAGWFVPAAAVIFLLALLSLAVLSRRRFAAYLFTLSLPALFLYLLACWVLPASPGARVCPRALVQEVLAQSPEAARIVNLRLLLKSIPFYTRRRVVEVDYPRDLRFEAGYAPPPARLPPSARGFHHFGQRPLRSLLYESGRNLFVTRETHMDYVRSIKPDVEEILRLDGLVLFANRPRESS